MNRTISRFGLGILLGAQILMFQNCSNTKFTPGETTTQASVSAVPTSTTTPTTPPTVTTPGKPPGTTANPPVIAPPICTTSLTDANRDIKILFLVDSSGSNGGRNGTDPTKKWRASAINDLVNRYAAKNNFFFGLATFQGGSAVAHIVSANGQGTFSNSQQTIQSGISAFMANPDQGSTPYKAALRLAQSMIAADLKANPAENAAYSVVMVSDGQATDYNSPDDIIPDVASIVNLAPSQVKLNGIFYYNNPSQNVPSNTPYLQNIATIGNGAFAVADSNQTIVLDDLLKVPVVNCH